ncbi:hypothetical protein MKX01_029467 [Papaver californicum]|nr:hypothetical protein MKX01_029467 [Papaver californicum]
MLVTKLVSNYSFHNPLAINVDNCLLFYDKFDNIPDQKIDRVIQNVRDHFNLIPDNDMVVIAIKKVTRNAYWKYRHDIHQAYCEALKIYSHTDALEHPPKTFPNKSDWAHMCRCFTTGEFKKNSERGRLVAAAKKINHSSGNKSHIRYEYKLVSVEQPCDPVNPFRLTHKSKNMNAKCKEMRKKMKEMKKTADRGETNDTPEEIYHKVLDAEYLGKRRRKAHPTPFSLYQKKEEEIAQMKVRITSMERENKRLKKETGPNTTKKRLNEYFAKHGMPTMELSDEDDAEENDEDADIHEHGDTFENNEREFEEEDGEAYEDDQEEGDKEYPDGEFE